MAKRLDSLWLKMLKTAWLHAKFLHDSKQEEEEEEEIQKEETQPSPDEVTQRGAQQDPENLDLEFQ